MTYKICKKLIELGNYDIRDLTLKLDVFLLHGRISQAEYEELIGMIEE